MKYLIEDDNFLTEEEKKHIQEQIKIIPFYLKNEYADGRKSPPMMTHILVNRIEDFPNSPDRTNSSHLNIFLNILIRFTKKYNISFSRILRGCINITYPFDLNFKKCHIHTDHPTPHNNFILYYGENIDGNLLLYNKNKKLIKKVKPKNFKIACFGDSSVLHSFEYPKENFRTAIVFTFD